MRSAPPVLFCPVRILLIGLFLFTLLGNEYNPAIAQNASQTPEISTETPAPAETPIVEFSPTDVAVVPVETETPTELPVVIPSSTATDIIDWESAPDSTETEVAPATRSAETATPSPTVSQIPSRTVTATSQFSTSSPAGVNVTVKLIDTFGPALQDVCLTLREGGAFNYPISYQCTGANGIAHLQASSQFQGSRIFLVEIVATNDYMGPDVPRIVGLSWGTDLDIEMFVTPHPTGTETLKSVDGQSGLPLGGVCWSYYANDAGVPGALKYGPDCDDDSDGAVVVSDITRGAYCLVATAPAGYQIVGADPICTVSSDRNLTVVKAFVTTQPGSTGSIAIHAKLPWNAPLENVCPRIVASISGQNVDVGGECTDSSGNLTIAGLFPGSFNVVNGSLPGYFRSFDPIPVTVSADASVPVEIAVQYDSAGDIRATAVYGYGPQTLAGACWSYQTSLNLQPTGNVVMGPVCDTDGDGVTVLAGIPRGAFCVVIASPPPGYTHTGNQYVCLDNMAAGALTVGFSPPIVPTATMTRTATPAGPTITPTATATAIVTLPPVGNEPNSGLTVKNCYQSSIGNSDSFPDQLLFFMCENAPAGINLAIIQNGTQVGIVTTQAGGVAAIALTSREPYSLRYLDGNGTTWASGTGQEAKLRYDSAQSFYFQPAPDVDTSLTLTIRVKFSNVWNGNGYVEGAGIGGACFRIIGRDSNEYLPITCDTDNDGVIVMGQLPARFEGAANSSFYQAQMTTAPTGYDLLSAPRFGSVLVSNPGAWFSTYEYSPQSVVVRTEDPDGNLVPGFCYRLGARVRYNNGTVYQDQSGCDYQGITRITINAASMGLDLNLRITSSSPGYAPDQTFRNILATPASTVIYVTFIVRTYGTTEPDQASVRLQLRDHGGKANSDVENGVYCATLSPAATPMGSVCESESIGDIIFTNLDAGTYTASFTENRVHCNYRAPVTFTIAEADLGGEKIVPVVIDCGYKPNCNVFRDRPGRTVNVYIGDLFDTDGTLLTSELQLSESIPVILTEQLLREALPAPDRINVTTLAPWTDSLGEGGSETVWDLRPDYDGNAHQRMLNAFGAYGTITPGSVSNLGTVSVISSVSTVFTYYPTPNELKDFPECEAGTTDLFVSFLNQATVNFYRIDAQIAATPTATITPPPSITAIPTQEPICFTTASRDVTGYYGTLTDGNGNALLNALALSDRIPLALRNAIQNASSPGEVRTLINNWLDRGLVDEDWGFGPSDGLDPVVDLQRQYEEAASDVTLGRPDTGQTITYDYTSYRLYDEYELPEGCGAPDRDAEIRGASLGRLIPVLQTTHVQITWYQVNAVAGGTIQPTATPTTTTEPTSSPGASATAETGESTATATPTGTTAPAEPTETAIAGATDNPDASPTPASGEVIVSRLPNTGVETNGSGSMPGAFETLAILLLAVSGLSAALRARRRVRA